MGCRTCFAKCYASHFPSWCEVVTPLKKCSSPCAFWTALAKKTHFSLQTNKQLIPILFEMPQASARWLVSICVAKALPAFLAHNVSFGFVTCFGWFTFPENLAWPRVFIFPCLKILTHWISWVSKPNTKTHTRSCGWPLFTSTLNKAKNSASSDWKNNFDCPSCWFENFPGGSRDKLGVSKINSAILCLAQQNHLKASEGGSNCDSAARLVVISCFCFLSYFVMVIRFGCQYLWALLLLFFDSCSVTEGLIFFMSEQKDFRSDVYHESSTNLRRNLLRKCVLIKVRCQWTVWDPFHFWDPFLWQCLVDVIDLVKITYRLNWHYRICLHYTFRLYCVFPVFFAPFPSWLARFAFVLSHCFHVVSGLPTAQMVFVQWAKYLILSEVHKKVDLV